MIKLYKTNLADKKLHQIDEITPGCWIDLVSPTEEEIDQVVTATEIDRDLIIKMRDENELPRVETSENATLVVVDTPFVTDEHEYVTYPLGIIVADTNYVITISPRRTTILNSFRRNLIGDFRTAKKTRFLIQILALTSADYLKVLGEVYRDINQKEETLEKSTKNEDLIDLLATEKTLVYFTTSLKENDLVLERLSKGGVLPLYEGDLDLIEDAIIENKQAIDMAKIYRDILSSITNTYATVISNNLNYAMKFLAGITIVLSIPTIISSFLGMNVPFGIIGDSPFSAWILFFSSIILSLGVVVLLKKKGLL